MTEVEITVISGLAGITAQDWDACTAPDAGHAPDPFTTYRFLKALEDSGSVGAGTGWEPHHLIARRNGKITGVAPLYAKNHSQGEYVFDHSWADAYVRAGGSYYPKLQMAVPFTPVTGRRFLTDDPPTRQALAQAAVKLCAQNQLSSLHCTFCDADEVEALEPMGLLRRSGQQFHWVNQGYSDFDGFLADLSSRKRKNIRKERATAQGFGGTIRALTGDQIEPSHWDAFWQFYQDTGARKWGTPYLTRRFFDLVHETMRDDVLLVLAELDGQPVAGALNFIGRDALYGRYWGALAHFPCLHFELCYYQAIDYAIAHGLDRVEAGAQGEHKLARGYLPVETHSLHWIADEGFSQAVQQYLTAERNAVEEEIEILTSYGPFKQQTVEEQE